MMIFVSSPRAAAIYRADYSSLTLTDADAAVVARAVAAEGRGRCCLIKTCIAAVIYNRLLCDMLPGEVSGVAWDGAVFPGARDTGPTDDEIFEASTVSSLVLAHGIDPTCGALFIMEEGDPDIELFTVTLKVEGLVFAKP